MKDNSVNIFDIETFVRQFMVEQIKKTQPELDTGENSSFDDIFVKPMNAIASQMMQAMSLIEYRTNLKYADRLTDDQVNDIGENNYSVTRKQGTRSSVVQTFSFNEISEDGITIPAGVVITSDDGYAFYTGTESYFTKAQLLAGFNANSKLYSVTARIYAEKTGAAYNKGANTINSCQTNFSTALVSTTNTIAATGGTDTESTADYVERMRTYYASQHLGSEPGYRLFIQNLFPTLQDIKVVGYGDAPMKRDIIRYIPASAVVDGKLIDNWDYVERHMGGCVDIYVKGSEYKLVSKHVTSTSRVILINAQVSSEISYAKDSAGNTYKCKAVYLESATSEYLRGKSLIIIGEEEFTEASVVTVQYTLIDEGNNIDVSETYLVDPFYETEVESPLSQNVVSAIYTDVDGFDWDNKTYLEWKEILAENGVNVIDQTSAANEDCKITRKTVSGAIIDDEFEFKEYYVGSSKEKNAIILSPYIPNTYVQNGSFSGNGGTVNITTSYNVTLNEANAALMSAGNRIITGDVLVREANITYVNVSLQVELLDDTGLSDLRKTQIHSVISQIFDNTPVGGTIEQSDIIGELYSNELTKSYIKYVSVPLTVFYIDGEVETNTIPPNYIKAEENAYLTLKNFSVDTISEAGNR